MRFLTGLCMHIPAPALQGFDRPPGWLISLETADPHEVLILVSSLAAWDTISAWLMASPR